MWICKRQRNKKCNIYDKNLTERAIEIQKYLYLCFIDYTKAFDKLRHEEIMSILDSLNIDGKYLRIVRNIYWEQTAAIRIGHDLSTFQDMKRGLRQGCVLSPRPFFHLQRDNHASPRRHARYKSRLI